MTTGSSADIVSRVKSLIPNRWFAWAAPYRDAIIGGLADSAAWNYVLIGYARAQTRLSTAYGIWLDIFAYDFLGPYLTRNGLSDDTFRTVIRATILQERVTRAGMIGALTTITGNAPKVFEPWNTYDTGAYSNFASGQIYGSMGYGVGRGGYGNMNLPGQALVTIQRSTPSGVPNVGGYGSSIGGYGVGQLEYVGASTAQVGITDAVIENTVNMTKPTGTTMWIQFGSTAAALERRPLILSNAINTQNLAVLL